MDLHSPFNLNFFLTGGCVFSIYLLYYVRMMELLESTQSHLRSRSSNMRMATFLLGFGLMWGAAKAFPHLAGTTTIRKSQICFWKVILILVLLTMKDLLYPQLAVLTVTEPMVDDSKTDIDNTSLQSAGTETLEVMMAF